MDAEVNVRILSRTDTEWMRKLRHIKQVAAEAPEDVPPLAAEPVQPSAPSAPVVEPAQEAYFKIGSGLGRPGEVVPISVLGGCAVPVSGFVVGAGMGHVLQVERVELGAYLSGRLGDNKFIDLDIYASGGRPEPYWRYAIWFLEGLPTKPSDRKEDIGWPPLEVPIPLGTVLLKVYYKIPEGTFPKEYTLYCADKWFSQSSGALREDFTYAHYPQGTTRVRCESGSLLVTE